VKRAITKNYNNERHDRKIGFRKNPIKNQTERKRIEREARRMISECQIGATVSQSSYYSA